MVQAPRFPNNLANPPIEDFIGLSFQLPNPEDGQIPVLEFQQQVDAAWLVCDRFDLQTDIWRGRILRVVRDREKCQGDGRGSGFLNWLKEQEISKSRAYTLIELANSADKLLENGHLDLDHLDYFSKRAFIETAQAAPEVQQLVNDLIKESNTSTGPPQRITRREVKQLSDQWTAMTSDLLPPEVKEKAATSTLPPRYLAPLVRELEKLPESHQTVLRAEVAASPDVSTLKQVTAEARNLARYLSSSADLQALNIESVNLELALEEALRLGCLNITADLVYQAAQLEQAIAKLYTTWKRVSSLNEKLYVESGSSTPHLRSLLSCLQRLSGEVLEVQLGDPQNDTDSRIIRLQVLNDIEVS
jgi:hypothetical protein